MDLNYTLSSDRPTQLGLVVLQSDETLERDMRWLLPKDVELLVSRVPSGTELSVEFIAAMEGKLTDAATLLPRGPQLASVGYGCTSASAQIGTDRVAELIKAGVPTDHVTNPVSALIAACRALNLRKIGLISPYIASISDRLRDVLAGAGITAVRFGSFNEPIEANVVRISPQSLKDAALSMAQDHECEGIFLSCTNLRTLDVIDEIEAEIGRPVLSSNQVLAWHMLGLAGITQHGATPGKLWTVSPVAG